MTILFVITYLFYWVAYIFALKRFLEMFFSEKRTPKWLFAASYTAYFIMSITLFIMNIGNLFLILSTIFIFVLTLNYKSPVYKRFVAVVSFVAVLVVIEVVIYQIFPEYSPSGVSMNYETTLALFVTGIMFVFMGFIPGRFKSIKKNTVTLPMLWVTSLVIPTISFVLVIWISRHFPPALVFVSISFVFLFNILVFYMHNALAAAYEGKLKLKDAEAAEESSKAKSRFLARISHEIRTPISAVMGISEMQLRNRNVPPNIEECFAKIYDSSKLLLNIVNDILDFSKIEAGKMPIIDSEYDVASLVSDVAQLRLVYLDGKDVKFQMHIDKDIPAKLTGDSLRIRQIIGNLLTNSFKYTEAGTVTLSLQCEKKDEEHTTLIVSIQDTGIGMTVEQLDKIMCLNSEYIRLHEQENPDVGGTGLGLPIVFSLAKMMNAQLDMKSEAGKGTSVVFRISQKLSGTEVLGAELARRLQNFEADTWSASDELNFAPEPMPHGKVLVVDDIDINLEVAMTMMEFFSLNAEGCKSGQEAIDKVQQGNVYNIIFMDHMMPDMDGVEATRILRNMGYNQPIIALTANALKGQAEMFMENGFSGFISKPIDIKILHDYLVRFIKGKK